MDVIRVELPDGSVKEVPVGSTPLEVARTVERKTGPPGGGRSPGWADGRSHPAHRETSRLELITLASPEGLDVYRHSAAHLMAHAVKIPVRRRGAGDDRPGHRERLLLRFLQRRAHLFAGGIRGHRKEDGRTGCGRSSHRPGGGQPRQRHSPVSRDGRNVQGAVDRGSAQCDGIALSAGGFRRSVPRSPSSFDRPSQGVQVDQCCRRLLARRRKKRHAAAHLRHGVSGQKRPQSLSGPTGGGQASATIASWGANSTSSPSARRRAPGW